MIVSDVLILKRRTSAGFGLDRLTREDVNRPTTHSNFNPLQPKNDARRFPPERVFRMPNSAPLFPKPSPPKMFPTRGPFAETGCHRGRENPARMAGSSLVVARETGRRARRSIAVRAALRRRQVRRTPTARHSTQPYGPSAPAGLNRSFRGRARRHPDGRAETTSRSGPHLGRKRYLRIVLPS